MARLTIQDARSLMSRGRPWCFRLECTTNGSSKFWLATGRGRNEPVEIHFGKIGAKPTIIVKDFAYVEQKAPEKEVKGYVYVDTPYVRVSQPTIDAFVKGIQQVAAHATPAPTPSTPPPAPVVTTPPPAGAPDTWRCDKGGLTCRIKGAVIEVVFDDFPASWQGQVYHTFKDALELFATQFMGRKIGTWWGGDDGEIFHVKSNNKGLFCALVAWFQQQIPGSATPLMPQSPLTGPFAKVRFVRRAVDGTWDALNAAGAKVMSLTAQGARDLVTEYPDHVSVAGL